MFKVDLNPQVQKETHASNDLLAQSSQVFRVNILQQLYKIDILSNTSVYNSIPINYYNSICPSEKILCSKSGG